MVENYVLCAQEIKMNVLITSIGATGSQNVIKALRKQVKYPVNIIGCDASVNNAGKFFVDKFYKLPFANDTTYIPTILDICTKESVNLLIPIMEQELEVVAQNLIVLEKFNPVISELKIIEICNDKSVCNPFIKALGINVPKEYDKLSDVKSFPVIIKPKKGTGSTNIIVVNDATQLASLSVDAPRYIIQDFIKGKEFTVDCYTSLVQDFCECVPRERLITKGGLCTQTKTVNNKELIDCSRKINKALKIKGPSNIQFIIDENTNVIYFIEINPRFGGAYIASIEAGLNAPLFLLNEINKDKIEYSGFRVGLVMYRYWQEAYEYDMV